MNGKKAIIDSFQKDNDAIGRRAVVVCTDTHTFSGETFCSYDQRLLDALNEGLAINATTTGKYFLPLENVRVIAADGTTEEVASTYVRKSNILFVCEKGKAPPRTACADSSQNPYVYKEKVTLGVEVHFPAHVINGWMHNDIWEQMIETLEREDSFLPITNARISPEPIAGEAKYDFVAINKDRALFIAQS